MQYHGDERSKLKPQEAPCGQYLCGKFRFYVAFYSYSIKVTCLTSVFIDLIPRGYFQIIFLNYQENTLVKCSKIDENTVPGLLVTKIN